MKLISEFKFQMNKIYKLSDLGPIHWLLGIKVTQDLPNHTISSSQHAFINSILLRFNFTDLKPSSVLMDPSTPLSKSQSPTKLADCYNFFYFVLFTYVFSLFLEVSHGAATLTHFSLAHIAATLLTHSTACYDFLLLTTFFFTLIYFLF